MLLAAGGSTRFGTPKQLAVYNGKTLIRIAAEAIASSGCSTVVAVLGANHESIAKELAGLEIHTVVNPEWQTGMSSSIRTGLVKLLEIEPDLDAVLITLMDQPLVMSEHLAVLINAFLNFKDPIVAAGYQGTAGVPALFSREHFASLAHLTGDKGARQIIRQHLDTTRIIDLPEAGRDIDEPGDLAGRWQQQ